MVRLHVWSIISTPLLPSCTLSGNQSLLTPAGRKLIRWWTHSWIQQLCIVSHIEGETRKSPKPQLLNDSCASNSNCCSTAERLHCNSSDNLLERVLRSKVWSGRRYETVSRNGLATVKQPLRGISGSVMQENTSLLKCLCVGEALGYCQQIYSIKLLLAVTPQSESVDNLLCSVDFLLFRTCSSFNSFVSHFTLDRFIVVFITLYLPVLL